MKKPNIETKSEHLYHYTDANGLIGILEKNEIWATDSRFLNDSMEIKAGIDLAKNHLKSKVKELENSETKYKEEIIHFYGVLSNLIEQNLINRNIYIASFTKHRDNLRQWMSYCPANAGYAIVFKTDKLFDHPPTLSESLAKRLMDVNYKKELDDEELEPERLIKKLEHLIFQKEDIPAYTLELSNRLVFKCAAIKNEEFYDEDEVRLLMLSDINKSNKRNHRNKSGIILPYQKFEITKNCISEIIIGPNANMELAKSGLNDLLHKNSYNCKVTFSNCSLRVF